MLSREQQHTYVVGASVWKYFGDSFLDKFAHTQLNTRSLFPCPHRSSPFDGYQSKPRRTLQPFYSLFELLVVRSKQYIDPNTLNTRVYPACCPTEWFYGLAPKLCFVSATTTTAVNFFITPHAPGVRFLLHRERMNFMNLRLFVVPPLGPRKQGRIIDTFISPPSSPRTGVEE